MKARWKDIKFRTYRLKLPLEIAKMLDAVLYSKGRTLQSFWEEVSKKEIK